MLALQKDPGRRYSSVAQFRDDVARYRNGLPVMAQGDRFGYRAEKFLRRNLAAVSAVTLVILSLTAGIVVSLAGSETSQARAACSRSAAQHRRRPAPVRPGAAGGGRAGPTPNRHSGNPCRTESR